MANQLPQTPETETLTRVQVLIAMGVTALFLLMVAKIWQRVGGVPLLPLDWMGNAPFWGIGLGLGISATSAIIYRLWPAYRQSANLYLDLVIRPLAWPDLVWLGLLPGISEELLFRGVMLPALGFDLTGLALSSLCFGALHLSSLKNWPYMLWAMAIGAVLGLSALITGNLLVPLAAHIVTNLISGCVWKWHSDQKPNPSV
ncbi:CPBP family intramembrane metalloprotease [Trichocoleus sp. FACHB-591]|uniref:CPBP family intramembrane glutamic endopeptidase n=1 Tax=Trichocoleus sp. FACHB-591 TaxID=2692872 RepID=UPI001685E29E|nr:CPBP family intramembrane metalloprotease [Trichocoleus sp. FACHB-591]